MLRSAGGSALLVVAVACAGARPANDTLSDAATARAVRAARERFNAAIAGRDTATIAASLLPTYHIVTGRSAQGHGVADEVALWQSMFADTTLLYVRRSREVRSNAAWGLAEELGDWTGHLTALDGPVRVSGSYAAKWQRDTGGNWRLQSEVFTTLRCDGGPQGCKPPDPVAPTK
jgi:ketosteroid isomerase-like protein